MILTLLFRVFLFFAHALAGWRSRVWLARVEGLNKEAADFATRKEQPRYTLAEIRQRRCADAVLLRLDHAESRCLSWTERSEQVAALREWFASYRGKNLPYLLGHVEAALIFAFLRPGTVAWVVSLIVGG